MISEKSLRIAFVIVFLSFLWTLLRLNNKTEELKGKNTEIKTIKLQKDSIQKIADSLYDENFICQIDLGRYQIAYEILKERNPKAASQYDDIISKETE